MINADCHFKNDAGYAIKAKLEEDQLIKFKVTYKEEKIKTTFFIALNQYEAMTPSDFHRTYNLQVIEAKHFRFEIQEQKGNLYILFRDTLSRERTAAILLGGFSVVCGVSTIVMAPLWVSTVITAAAVSAGAFALVGAGVQVTMYGCQTEDEDFEALQCAKEGLGGGLMGTTCGIGVGGTMLLASAGMAGSTSFVASQVAACVITETTRQAIRQENWDVTKIAAAGALGGISACIGLGVVNLAQTSI